MIAVDAPHRPAWLDDSLYPFVSRGFDTPRGQMHYVDEGQGRPIVFVHGNPTWSFEYREPIRALRDRYRCIAPDHLGFGLSAKSGDPDDHHPAVHAENFGALMASLGLTGVILVFSDWGGPIALDYARRHPQQVAGLVVLNSWCWPVEDVVLLRLFSGVMASRVGQYLVRRHHLFVRALLPLGLASRRPLPGPIMLHYRAAQPDPRSRAASADLPGHIIGASDWLSGIWRERARFAQKPSMILWGMKDPAFRRRELGVWRRALSNASVHELPRCGHFVAEECPQALARQIHAFVEQRVASTSPRP